ncbi:GAF domain-containing sensor histidine kinase [Nannocystis sp. ILAH1]|uniref:GAF domain-containing sensor histidine kinase n=1 Tax=unclassified Nannocystis TaxID=2627009 RepID=UPI0022710352|nr:GAF domain-containing sensor histidine kinase [Nannocystis sp. ILAH1]MCY1072026.1 GAF domain-containing sensor histidine kinase [Nannocystis sp. RBIL2]
MTNSATDDELLGLLADCGELLARPSDPLTAMVDVVRKIGQALDADRMQYFVRDTSARVSHCISAWVREGIEPMRPGPYRDEDFDEVIRPLSRGEIYSTTLASKSGRNLEVNAGSGTTADLLVPVLVDGEVRGILSIDQCRGQAVFPAREVSTLRSMAVLIASTLGRSDAEGTRSRAVRRRHLAREAAMESALDVVGDLLLLGDLESALDQVLPHIGAMAACHRVVLLMRDELDGRPCHRLTQEWLAPGQPSQATESLSVLFDDVAPPGAVAGLASGSPFWWRTAGRSDPFSLRHQALGVAVSGALPLLVEGGYAGMLAFGWCFEPNLGADGVEFRVLQLAANSIAAALQRQRAIERRIERERERLEAVQFEQARHARHRADQLEAANAVLRAINQRMADGGEPVAALQAILEQAVLAVGARAGGLTRLLGGELHLVAFMAHAMQPPGPPAPDTRAASRGTPSNLAWRHVEEDDTDGGLPWRDRGIEHVLDAEIFDGDQVVGVLRLGFSPAPEHKDAIEWLVEAICQQTALAIRLSAMSTELERRTRRETLLAERSRMAREIHDGVAQGFTGILLQLGALAETQSDLAHAKELARRAAGLAREGLADARRAVMALQPEGTSREDLASALAHLVECASVPGKVACDFRSQSWDVGAELGPVHSHDLYRVVQEALNNALRHAQATAIEVTLARTSTGIRLQVEDDGVGFVEGDSDGFGIRNMRARIQDMGGSLRIDSMLGAGTRLVVDMPLTT